VTTTTGESPPNPWLSWRYLQDNWGDVAEALGQHIGLTVQAVLIAALLALPLAALAHVRPRLAGAVLGISGALYTVPSLALFALIYPFLLDARLSVLIGLVMYALLVLVRNVLVGLQGVPEEVRDAARGLGYRRARLLLTVELPHATPAVVAGLRLATVTTVALVTIGVVVGYGGLGQLMFRGFQSDYHAEIMTATLLCVALALAADVALRLIGHLVTPWLRTGSRA
jgi:osmoprotectant transport system permease protein